MAKSKISKKKFTGLKEKIVDGELVFTSPDGAYKIILGEEVAFLRKMILRTQKNKEGKVAVYIEVRKKYLAPDYSFKYKHARINTGVYIDQKHWSKSKKLILPKEDDAKKKNAIVNQFYNQINDYINTLDIQSSGIFRNPVRFESIIKMFPPPNKPRKTLTTYFDEYITLIDSNSNEILGTSWSLLRVAGGRGGSIIGPSSYDNIYVDSVGTFTPDSSGYNVIDSPVSIGGFNMDAIYYDDGFYQKTYADLYALGINGDVLFNTSWIEIASSSNTSTSGWGIQTNDWEHSVGMALYGSTGLIELWTNLATPITLTQEGNISLTTEKLEINNLEGWTGNCVNVSVEKGIIVGCND